MLNLPSGRLGYQMALEGLARKPFDEIKYRQKFPPREDSLRIKSEMVARGMVAPRCYQARVRILLASPARATG